MSEIEFSVMGPENVAGLQPLLDQFEAQHRIKVRVRPLRWDTSWSDLVKVAIYGDGPDISEIGSTWLGDFVAMNALAQFDEAFITSLGRANAFLPTTWQSGQGAVWAIPWFTGARLLFYRRSLLAQANINPAQAFGTATAFDQTLAQLQAAGVSVSWTVPTGHTHTTLLNTASWVWGAGGDFVSPDGKRTLFSEDAARAGLRAYFALGRYLAPSVRHLNGLEPDEQFLHDPQTALTLSGSWLFGAAQKRVGEDLAVALPPGAPFVGGSYFVVWKHSRKQAEALKLIRYLTQTPAQVAYSQQVGLLPARLEAHTHAPYTQPLWQRAIEGVKAGRSFPPTRSWGLMEDRLTTELHHLWQLVLENPAVDLDAALHKRLDPLARRLDLVLGQ